MKHEYLKPISQLTHFIKEDKRPYFYNRKLLPKKYNRCEVRNVSIYSYQECSKCHNKHVIQMREEYRPIAMCWEEVWKEQLKNRWVLL